MWKSSNLIKGAFQKCTLIFSESLPQCVQLNIQGQMHGNETRNSISYIFLRNKTNGILLFKCTILNPLHMENKSLVIFMTPVHIVALHFLPFLLYNHFASLMPLPKETGAAFKAAAPDVSSFMIQKSCFIKQGQDKGLAKP